MNALATVRELQQFLRAPSARRIKGVSPFPGDRALSRRDVALALELHQDSVSRRLSDGLGSAILRAGGQGKEMSFSWLLVSRWHLAITCRRGPDGHCRMCSLVLEDAMAVAEHLNGARHGYGGCEECSPPPNLCVPCGGI